MYAFSAYLHLPISMVFLKQYILLFHCAYHSALPALTLPKDCKVLKRVYLHAAKVFPRIIDDRRGEHADQLSGATTTSK